MVPLPATKLIMKVDSPAKRSAYALLSRWSRADTRCWRPGRGWRRGWARPSSWRPPRTWSWRSRRGTRAWSGWPRWWCRPCRGARDPRQTGPAPTTVCFMLRMLPRLLSHYLHILFIFNFRSFRILSLCYINVKIEELYCFSIVNFQWIREDMNIRCHLTTKSRYQST